MERIFILDGGYIPFEACTYDVKNISEMQKSNLNGIFWPVSKHLNVLCHMRLKVLDLSIMGKMRPVAANEDFF